MGSGRRDISDSETRFRGMRDDLTTILTARYPALYGQHFGFEHHGGWFSLIDALSEALVTGAEVAGRPPPRASQVKEKFGTLRWYHGGDAFDDGAIDFAEEMSGRICERTGRPGRLGSRGGWWATRAPGIDGIEPTAIGFQKDGTMGTPPLGFTATEMTVWPSDVLRGPVDVPSGMLAFPKGWRDIADGVLCLLGHRSDDGPRVFVERVSVHDGALRFEHTGGAYADGVVAAAVALSQRTDVMEGGLL